MPLLSIITVYKDSAEDLLKTEGSVLSEFGSSEVLEYIQKEWSAEQKLTEVEKQIDGKLPCRHIRGYDAGVFDGMLQALDYAKGEWVLFLNAGDWLAEGFADQFQDAIEGADEYDFLYFDGITVDFKDGRQFPRKAPIELRLSDFYSSAPVLHPSFLVRRSVMKAYSFNCKLSLAADFDLMVRLVADKTRGRHVPFFGTYVVSGGLSEQFRVRARWQATRSLCKHTTGVIERLKVITAFGRFLVMHTLIVGIIHRFPSLRAWLHRRVGHDRR